MSMDARMSDSFSHMLHVLDLSTKHLQNKTGRVGRSFFDQSVRCVPSA